MKVTLLFILKLIALPFCFIEVICRFITAFVLWDEKMLGEDPNMFKLWKNTYTLYIVLWVISVCTMVAYVSIK